MRVLYLDLEMGAAGDMLSAALFELLDEEQKKEYLEKIRHLGLEGVSVTPRKAVRCGITGTSMEVKINGLEELDAADTGSLDRAHGHAESQNFREQMDHGACDHAEQPHPTDHAVHSHHHTSPSHIRETIRNMRLSDTVRKNAEEVYRLLAEAEGRAHGMQPDQIHFHEVGEKDAVTDIVSVCLLVDMLKPERITASAAATGSGTVQCAHGILPVPAPATAYILQDRKIPAYAGQQTGELLTPTGAALIGYFADSFGPMPMMSISGIGYGMGKKDFPQADCVRAVIGEDSFGEDLFRENPSRDEIYEMSCNLDDMTPEDVAFAMERLFEAGALDVFTVPVGMKKSRPGVMLTALCHEEEKEEVVKAFFRYTTTIGIREKKCGRYIMKSEMKNVRLQKSHISGISSGSSGFSEGDEPGGEKGKAETAGEGTEKDGALERQMTEADDGEAYPLFGSGIRVKVSTGYGEVRVKPEYDDIALAAQQAGTSTDEIRRLVLQELE